jgi:hypothetical protein
MPVFSWSISSCQNFDHQNGSGFFKPIKELLGFIEELKKIWLFFIAFSNS